LSENALFIPLSGHKATFHHSHKYRKRSSTNSNRGLLFHLHRFTFCQIDLNWHASFISEATHSSVRFNRNTLMNISNWLSKLSLKFFIALLLFLVALGIFAYIAHEIVQEHEDSFDVHAFRFLAQYTSQGTLKLMRIFTFFGSHMFLIPAHLLILVIMLFQKRYMDGLITSFMAISSFLIMIALKNYFHRNRPSIRFAEVVQSFSFPSGHTFSSFVFAVVLIYLLWKSDWRRSLKFGLSLILLLFSCTVGLSRIVLRVHYASDVIAGFCIAVAWILFIIFIRSAFRNYSSGIHNRNE